jgi:hypothetical protein
MGLINIVAILVLNTSWLRGFYIQFPSQLTVKPKMTTQ